MAGAATAPLVRTVLAVATDAERATELLAASVGCYMTQLRVSAGDVQLLFDNGTLVRLAGATRLAEEEVVEEPQSLAGLAILLPLLNEDVRSAAVSPQGAMTLTFDAGVLTCLPGPRHEAWEFTTDAGAMVVCAPGGDLAIWSSGRPSQRDNR